MLSAQDNRVIFEYRFAPDSTKTDSLKTEWMYLDIKPKQFENDPVQSMREILSRPNSKVKINMGGKEIADPAEILRAMEQSAKEEMARNNNKIERIP